MKLRPETLNRYVQVLRPRLIEAAKRGGRPISYKELQEQQVSPGRGYIGEVLGRISEIELEAKRPYLSAIVVRQDTKRPGNGFWGLTGIDTNRPWEYYRDQVWQYWSTH